MNTIGRDGRDSGRDRIAHLSHPSVLILLSFNTFGRDGRDRNTPRGRTHMHTGARAAPGLGFISPISPTSSEPQLRQCFRVGEIDPFYLSQISPTISPKPLKPPNPATIDQLTRSQA